MPKKTTKRNAPQKRKKRAIGSRAKSTKANTAVASRDHIRQKKRALAAVPHALALAALDDDQNRNIVHECIRRCTGVSDFASDQPLSTIKQGREPCVQICVIESVHKPLRVRPSDSEDSIVGRI